MNESAIVKVAAGEASDVEDMLKLLVGEKLHFGVEARLVATDDPPEILTIIGRRSPKRQFGFVSADEMKVRKRYYQVHIHKQ